MPKEYEEIKASLRKAHPDWTESTLDERAAMTFGSVFGTNPQHAHELESQGKWEDYKKHHSKKEEKEFAGTQEIFNPGFEFKEDNGHFYVEGFVSTPELDLINDVVECQKSIVDQINSADPLASKLSYKHDWMRDGAKYDLPPLGKRVAAELRPHPKTGTSSAWAKYELNPNYPDFKEKVWPQIQNGFIDGFSIEHQPLDFAYKQIGNVRVRGLSAVRLVGVGVASRPVQPNAMMTGFYAKSFDIVDASLEQPARENKEVDVMENKEATPSDAVVTDLRAKLEAKSLEFDKLSAERKEYDAKLADLAKIEAEKKAFETELNALKQEKKILIEAKEQEELKARETLQAEFKEFQDKPSWEKATELISRMGGLDAFL